MPPDFTHVWNLRNKTNQPNKKQNQIYREQTNGCQKDRGWEIQGDTIMVRYLVCAHTRHRNLVYSSSQTWSQNTVILIPLRGDLLLPNGVTGSTAS